MRVLLVVSFLLSSFSPGLQASDPKNKSLSFKDKAYLHRLSQDTYRGIDWMVNNETGLPYDNSRNLKSGTTSITNIGFYAASLIGAVELGFESRASALHKLHRLLNSCSKLSTWRGIPYTWFQVSTLQPDGAKFVSTVDLGNYIAGLIAVRQYFPEVRPICDNLLKINWMDLYNPKHKLLYGGFDVLKSQYANWYYDYLGADSRMANFLAIAMSSVPMESWTSLNRLVEKRYGCEYLKPGWKGGVLFLGFMSGMFIDERGTLPWFSAANFAQAQLNHAEKMKYPVWGWSASDSPTHGYLGFNAIRDDIVTPHASVLAVSLFPKEVVQNLKKLEEMGARPRNVIQGEYVSLGFRDAIDMESSRVTSNYLVLDQEMLFLSLVNYLKNHVIQKNFQSYKPVQMALSRIEEYKQRDFKTVLFPVSLKDHYQLIVQNYDKVRPEFTAHDSVLTSEDFPTTQDWEKSEKIVLDKSNLESGNILNEKDLGAMIQFLWNSKYLYVRAIVTDDDIQVHHTGSEIYKDDIVEIYVNPNNRGLQWGNPNDYQIGVTPPLQDGKSLVYAWFQKQVPDEKDVKVSSERTPGGYTIVTKISWNYLSMKEPPRGQTLGISVAVHDIDEDKPEGAKLNCFFNPQGDRIQLCQLILK